eukprot:tig00020544_g10483.t1
MVPDEPSTTGVAAADDPFITGLNVSSTAVHASLREHTVHEKGGGVVVSCRKSRLIASADGSLFCYEVPPSLLREQALATISWPNNFERPVIKDDEQEEQELTFLEGELKNQREVEDAIYTTARNKARNAVRKLRQKLLAAYVLLYHSSKRLEIEKVHEKAERMRSIIDEIRKLDPVNHDLDSYKDDIFLPNLSEAEEPHRTLVVSDAEVHVEKVLSEEEQRRIELERQRAAERAKMEAGDDFALRALNEMMGGTLNAPTKETSAIEDIIRPSFMDDVPAEDWTEEQQKEAKEYEAKDKALREEREKAKKTLEAELKKCKQEVTEQCAKFDEAVQQLFELRISVDQSIFQNELFIIKLSMALLQDEEDEIQLRDLQEERAREAIDLELLCKLKQGQVEVEQAAVVTDYADGVLVQRSVVVDLNNIIRQLGKEKVTILKEIKDFRKGIHQLEWENKRLDMEAEDWVNKTREFQLLRVTKNLQELIKGGGDQAKQAQEVAQLENRLKHGAKLHEEHVKDKKTYVAKLDRQSQDKTYENSSLEERMHIMELNVVERQHIHALAVKPETQNVAEKRYKAMVTRRKLLEIAHAQSDEIELLREQLDALRQRTFPSFATA